MSSSQYISSGLTALANNAAVGAFPINANTDVSQFGTCTALNNSCVLPAGLRAGVSFTIILAAGVANQLNIFAPVGGTINGAASVALLAGGSLSVISANTNQFFSFINQSVGAGFAIAPVITVGAAATKDLAPNESGSVVALAATATKVNLPAPAAGLQYTVIASANPGNDIPISTNATAVILNGTVLGAATPVVMTGNKHTINFTTAKALAGDKVTFVSDGTIWSVTGNGQQVAAFTVAP